MLALYCVARRQLRPRTHVPVASLCIAKVSVSPVLVCCGSCDVCCNDVKVGYNVMYAGVKGFRARVIQGAWDLHATRDMVFRVLGHCRVHQGILHACSAPWDQGPGRIIGDHLPTVCCVCTQLWACVVQTGGCPVCGAMLRVCTGCCSLLPSLYGRRPVDASAAHWRSACSMHACCSLCGLPSLWNKHLEVRVSLAAVPPEERPGRGLLLASELAWPGRS